MHKGKKIWKRFFAAILSAVMIAGSVTGGMSGRMANAAGATVKSTVENSADSEEKNWYVLGRPMTEEEKEEQRKLIEYYNSLSSGSVAEQNSNIFASEAQTFGAPAAASDRIEPIVTAAALPSSYSSRDLGYTPAVRNQGNLGNCWAHASTAAVEISMVKNNVIAREDVDLSEEHLIYYICRPVRDPFGGTEDQDLVILNDTVYFMFHNGGTIGYSAASFLGWMGPVQAEDFYTYDYLLQNHNDKSQLAGLDDAEHAYGKKAAIVIETIEVANGQRDAMKQAIMDYGSLGIHYYSGGNYFEYDYAAQYCPDYISADHAVTAVGWDDNFPKENFRQTPPGDGAWLVRNSWGSGHGDGGYFWLSYYDNTMSGGRAYKAVSPDKYDYNYRYDTTGSNGSYINAVENGTIESVNIFEIKNDQEVLNAVQFATQWSNTHYSIQIYKNSVPAKEPVPQMKEVRTANIVEEVQTVPLRQFVKFVKILMDRKMERYITEVKSDVTW